MRGGEKRLVRLVGFPFLTSYDRKSKGHLLVGTEGCHLVSTVRVKDVSPKKYQEMRISSRLSISNTESKGSLSSTLRLSLRTLNNARPGVFFEEKGGGLSRTFP